MFISSTYLHFLLVLILASSGTWSATNPDRNPLDEVMTFDWDLAVSQGNGVALISISREDALEFTFPIPRNAAQGTKLDHFQTIKNATHSEGFKSGDLEVEWPHFEVKSLFSDPYKKVLYFSNSVRRRDFVVNNLCAFNFTSRETSLLFQTISGSIEDLKLYNNDLYFTDATLQAIMKVKVPGESFGESDFLQPVVVKQFSTNKTLITGFSFSSNGTLYWSSSNPSTISFSASDEIEHILLNADLKKAHDLTIVDDYLYFANTPQFGPQKTIERVTLSDPSDRQVLVNFESESQVPGTFTLGCEDLYWTDSVSKALWKMPLPSQGSRVKGQIFTKVYTSKKVNRHFNVFSYAVTSRQVMDSTACRSKSDRIAARNSAISPIIRRSDVNRQIEPSSKSQRTEAPFSPEVIPDLTKSSLPLETSLTVRKLEFCSDEESESSCMNGATCLFLEANLYCLCLPGFSGPKCEVVWGEGGVVASNLEKVTFSGESSETCSSTKAFLLLIATGLGSLCVLLGALTIILGIKVRRLNCNPKVHRRIIVSRPDTSLRSRHPSVNVCEMIDIENCCNMTICETPCYDSGSGRVSLVKGSKRHDDKERLLVCQ